MSPKGFQRCPAREPAAPLHFSPLLRGAMEVSGVLGLPEGPALDFPEALLALGLSQRHETSFEGVPHRLSGAQHALGSCCEPAQGAEVSCCGVWQCVVLLVPRNVVRCWRCAVGLGLWAVGCGLWSVFGGVWSMVFCLWFVVSGL